MPNPNPAKPPWNEYQELVEFIRRAMMNKFSTYLSMEEIASFSYSLGNDIYKELDRQRVEMRLLREDRAAWRKKSWSLKDELRKVADAKPAQIWR